MDSKHKQYLLEAIQLAQSAMDSNSGGPFGAIIVNQNGEIIGRGHNKVTSANDPTAHAEVVAIREACKQLKSYQLEGCTIYSSCEPCPMCLGAIYWARPKKLIYACTREDAASIGFDDQFIYDEINVEISNRKIDTKIMLRNKGWDVMKKWQDKIDKEEY